MGKNTEQARGSAYKAGKQQHKPKHLPKEELPMYENGEDMPVFDPDNMQGSIINQKKKKGKKKHMEEVIEEPQVEVQIDQH